MGTEGENVRVIAGRYRLEARIGRGGMGIVWRATDELLGRQVAVKELALDDSLPEERSRQRRERTLREARAVARLSHPHIIVVHDVVEQDERPYIVMELIDGGSLAERIATHGPVDAREAARIGLDLLGALRRAHDAGVLHRDLKPANVLLEAGTDRVVLTDFGIAQVAGATTLTESGSFVGSPEYTAPERMSGVRTGPESDLWSLGALLCAVLSGESPFRRDSLGGVLHAVVFDEIRPPAQAAPLLPVVRGLLERDPDRRLDAAEAERMLRAFRETGRTPRAAHEPRTPRTPRLSRAPSGYTPTRWDAPHERAEPGAQDAPSAGGRAQEPPASDSAAALREQPAQGRQPQSTRSVLVAAALVAAMAGAGVSAAALLMRDGGDGGGSPSTSAPRTPGTATASDTATASGPSGAANTAGTAGTSGTSDRSGTAGTSAGGTPTRTPSRAATAPTVPSGYRLAEDERGFSLAVPEGFTREPQGERVFYMAPGKGIRIGIKLGAPEEGGPLTVMQRAHEKGPSTNPGYRYGRVAETTHDGWNAALWEFTWDGFSAAEGPRHTYDLCWEQDGRLYDVWVSAPVGKVSEAREYFDVAVDTFVRS
ncbi:serine/threonine protein kinase [Streptomyces ipomoeae]|uniref:non-specific serine/threonine protein kinase n=1 Tax=Streptomyces ipomoeae TaxID=103232 RepID=A0AAE8VZK8_9ACTN|nr:serine/threonine-protein kinase [Streptomyces ipomoeae]MDX2827281.1 protein kinase [Streptomyces ipomoeae]MDX2879861.1 protein kinase [Streptomyces ipomoeae]TQE24128.1 serine/threonine protein kinase [Streptomyces ipomoeae]TQE24649.1 serine/threonine protein kinase [Streptomyces ipomoeae]